MNEKTTQAEPLDVEMGRELHGILDAIASEMAPEMAQHAALTLRAAATAARIDGFTFWVEASGDAPLGCIAGWLGHAIGRDTAFEGLPGWPSVPIQRTPIERYSDRLTSRKTEEPTPAALVLVAAIDDWIARR